MPHVHLGFHCFEVIRLVGLDLAAHSLAAPLPEAVEFSIHFEGVLVIMDRVNRRLNNDTYIANKRVRWEYTVLQSRERNCWKRE